ncbi:MAG: AmmeMemoRadiSam system radical SAM enzyme [Deltaproteobacteria bacterium]|nr:MAG: AmmeMemoRadiSam system radical SAM enzyme [Deltaproteobacteria bacterium]
MREAEHYTRENGKLRCALCPHRCLIAEGKKGLCGVRENRGGKLYALTYGKVAAVAVDPVEKKPLYHFYPGRDILSVGSVGCNFSCLFCQNWHLVEGLTPLRDVTPEELLDVSRRRGSIGISYTYNEPLIQWEFVRDCARVFREAGQVNVLVTNGFVNEGPLRELLPLVDAMNIDLKFFREETYRKISRGSLEPVKKTIQVASQSCLVEVTTLVVTGLNDTEEEIRAIVDFIASVDPSIPYHISRYFPHYKYDAPPTDEGFLLRAYEIAREKLEFVYLGNVLIPGTDDTRCPSCGELLISRRGYSVKINSLKGDRCGSCGRRLNIVV